MCRKNRQRESPPTPAPTPARLSPRILGLVWILLLLVGMLSAAWFAWRQIHFVEEFPVSCDSFGYQQMAEDFRKGSAPNGLPQFTAGSQKADLLIAELQRQQIPQIEWDALIGPQAYNYKPMPTTSPNPATTASTQPAPSGRLVNQYPPGVPLLLSLFPRGHALASLYLITWSFLVALAIAGLVALACLWWKSQSLLLLAAAGVWAVAFNLATMMLGTTVSYSADFFTVPGVIALILLCIVHNRSAWWLWPTLALAGASLGLALLIRVPVILLLPGFLFICIAGGTRRVDRALRAAVFSAALFLTGVLPLLLHQHALVGSPFRSTYGLRDVQSPSLSVLPDKFAYYFSGEGSLGNWALWMALLTAVSAIVLLRNVGLSAHDSRRKLLAWLATAALLFAVPAAYFLTHGISTSYYQLPAILSASLAVALGLWLAARAAPPSNSPNSSPRSLYTLEKIAAVILFLPGLAHLLVAFTPPNLTVIDNAPDHDIQLVAPLQNPSAWIYADRYTGTLWHFYGIHAQNILNGSPRARLLMYRFAFSRGEKQFIIRDIPGKDSPFGPILQEILDEGGRFVEVGRFDGQLIAEIVWPPTGPRNLPSR